MNTNDIDIELPPLPAGYKSYEFPDGGYDVDEMKAYARAAIEADRKRRAALQSQDRKDAARWRYWRQWCMNSDDSGQYPPEVDDAWHKHPDFSFNEAIDHARRGEGEGE